MLCGFSSLPLMPVSLQGTAWAEPSRRHPYLAFPSLATAGGCRWAKPGWLKAAVSISSRSVRPRSGGGSASLRHVRHGFPMARCTPTSAKMTPCMRDGGWRPYVLLVGSDLWFWPPIPSGLGASVWQPVLLVAALFCGVCRWLGRLSDRSRSLPAGGLRYRHGRS